MQTCEGYGEILVQMDKDKESALSAEDGMSLAVPNEKKALEIADRAMRERFGDAVVNRQQPFKAELKDGVWHVYGTLPDGNTHGGTAEAEVAQADGRIIRVWHGR